MKTFGLLVGLLVLLGLAGRADASQYRVATASWYNDAGQTASGHHYRLGFASLFLPFGARVRFCATHCATGTMQDHGPYVAGRAFDLNPGLRAELGCGDLCVVRWRLVRPVKREKGFRMSGLPETRNE